MSSKDTTATTDGAGGALDLPLDLLVAELAAGRVTSEELVRGALARIEAWDSRGPRLGAIIHVAPDALDQACASDARRRRGESWGVLDGVPVSVKDCIETADLPTTHGSRLFDGWGAGADAPVVARLRSGGAIVLATASLDDFAAACFGESSLRGTIRNPLAPGRMVSGSSGGSAVSVAAGYVPLSLGTDTGGSLRIPAALCGVVTLRPTAGLLPQEGIFPRSPSQDTAGPIAATVAGVALGLDAIVGDGSGERASAPRGRLPAGGYTRNLPEARSRLAPGGPGAPLAGLRLGYVRTGLALWGDDPDGPVLEAVDRTVEALRGQGAEVVLVAPPDRGLLDSTSLITQESRAAVDAYLAARPGAPVQTFRELVDSGAFTRHAADTFAREVRVETDPDASRATHERRALLRSWTVDLLEREGLCAVLYPTVQQVAGQLGEEQPGIFTRWSEHTGFPALALPSGETGEGGLRASVEMLGRPGDELIVLAAGQLVEACIAAQAQRSRHRSPFVT